MESTKLLCLCKIPRKGNISDCYPNSAGVKIFLVITLTISNGILTFLTDKIVQKVHERFHTEKDEKAIGKFG